MMQPITFHAPTSWETLKSVHEKFADIFVPIAEAGGAVPPQVFIVELRDGGNLGRIAVFPTEIAEMFFSAEDSHEQLRNSYRELLTEGHSRRAEFELQHEFAPGVIVDVAEAWRTAEATDLTDQGRAGVAETTDEVLLISLHTVEGTIPVAHVISPMSEVVYRAPFPEADADVLIPYEEPDGLVGKAGNSRQLH